MGSNILISAPLQNFYVISNSGKLILPDVFIDVDFGRIIGGNNLSLGVMLQWEWKIWLESPILKNKSAASNSRLFRVQDFRIQPCKWWEEQDLEGTYDWTDFDALIQSIYEIGGEPLICIGRDNRTHYNVPLGMAINPLTGLPHPQSFGAYASDLVQHSKEKGWNVRYWEIWNEPANYMFEKDEEENPIWGVFNRTRMEYFIELFNVVSGRMHTIDPRMLVGTDASLYKNFFDYFVDHAEDVGFLSFHKYDAWGTLGHNPEGYLSDEEILARAGRIGGQKMYSPREARELWQEKWGIDIPVICSETNLNSAWRNGTDPRIQQIFGAVWYAETVRTFITDDVRYFVYFHFASNTLPRATGGAGFGMVNVTWPHEVWYPYIASLLLGSNLGLADPLHQTVSSNQTLVSALSWENNGHLNVLLNHKVKSQSIRGKIRLSGLEVEPERTARVYTINSSEREIGFEETVWREASTVVLDSYCVVLVSVPLLT